MEKSLSADTGRKKKEERKKKINNVQLGGKTEAQPWADYKQSIL